MNAYIKGYKTEYVRNSPSVMSASGGIQWQMEPEPEYDVSVITNTDGYRIFQHMAHSPHFMELCERLFRLNEFPNYLDLLERSLTDEETRKQFDHILMYNTLRDSK